MRLPPSEQDDDGNPPVVVMPHLHTVFADVDVDVVRAHREGDRISARASATVTRVHGGESLTSIPARAWFELDVRMLNATRLPALLDELLDEMQQVINRARIDSSRGDPLRGGRSLAPTIDIIGDRPGEALDARHPLAQLANDASRWHDTEPQFGSASTDANVPLSRRIPAITIGAGGVGGSAHTLDEWYEDAHDARGLARALAIISSAAHGTLSPS